MTDMLMELYKSAKLNLERYKQEKLKEGYESVKEVDELAANWEEQIHLIETNYPNTVQRYERHVEMQNSFTYEQKDFICYQIGEWYLEWKSKITTGDGHGHRLGYAKEKLKDLLCGE